MERRGMIRSKKILNAAQGQPCVCCERNDGTIVPAHYQGWRSHALGKGRNIKVHDIAVAFLCRECHEIFDSTSAGGADQYEDIYIKRIVHSEEVFFCVMKTIINLMEREILVIK
jgi:hypothetical protein